jgi:hypothetical protein
MTAIDAAAASPVSVRLRLVRLMNFIVPPHRTAKN